jgi:hypothetical protein
MAMPYLRMTVIEALPEPRSVSGARRTTRTPWTRTLDPRG